MCSISFVRQLPPKHPRISSFEFLCIYHFGTLDSVSLTLANTSFFGTARGMESSTDSFPELQSPSPISILFLRQPSITSACWHSVCYGAVVDIRVQFYCAFTHKPNNNVFTICSTYSTVLDSICQSAGFLSVVVSIPIGKLMVSAFARLFDGLFCYVVECIGVAEKSETKTLSRNMVLCIFWSCHCQDISCELLFLYRPERCQNGFCG